jgi:two-component system, sporulation sensor kinase A
VLKRNQTIGNAELLALFGAVDHRPSPLAELAYQSFVYSPAGMLLLNTELQILLSNESICRQLGLTADHLSGQSLPSLIHSGDLLLCMHQLSQFLAGQIEPYQAIIRLTHAAGHTVWTHITVSMLGSQTGNGRYILVQAMDMTEKKQAELALQESALKISSLLETIPDAFIMLNRQWQFTYLNKGAEQMIRRKREQLLGREIWDLFPEAVDTNLYSAYYQSMEEQEPRHLQNYYPPHERWYDISCYPSKHGLTVFFRDITTQKQQEQELLSTKLHLDSMIDNAADSIVILDDTLRIIRANQAFWDMYGYREEELAGNIPKTIPTELVDETEHLFRKVFSGEQIPPLETRRLRKDGTLIDVSLTLSPIINADRKVVSICIIGRDITMAKHLERKLRESQERYRLIAENTKDFVSLMDVRGKVLFASPSHRAIARNPSSGGDNAFDLLKEPWKTKAVQWFQDIVQSREARQIELTLPSKEHESMVVESKGVPILGQDGQAEAVLIVSRDISERKKTEELLRHSEKLSIAGQLAAGIAHEIRNPLTALKGFIQFMQSDSVYREQYLQIMISELNRIEQIISELLMLAKPQTVHFQVKPLEPILTDVVSLLESHANISNVMLDWVPSGDMPPVRCEENQLKQVFINILKNAIEAMPLGGSIQIRAAASEREPGMLELTFRDEGIGIPQELLGRLGEPFYTTKEKGSGLGLMVSQKIINEHEGRMHFASRPSLGTTVTILLPAIPS